MVGIYAIQNTVNGKIYIGQSINIELRWSVEKRKKGLNSYLIRSMSKYGIDKFIFYVVEICEKQELNYKEKFYIKLYHSYNKEFGYNLTTGGDSSFERKYLYPMSDIVKEKHSKALKGRKVSEETKERLRKGREKALLKKHTFDIYVLETNEIYHSLEEVVEKLNLDKNQVLKCLRKKCEKHRGYHICYAEEKDTRKWNLTPYKNNGGKKYWNKDSIEKIRKARLGKKHSEETKEKLRMKNIGKKLSKEHRLKISESQKGKKRKEGTGENISKGKILSNIKKAKRKIYIKELDRSFYSIREIQKELNNDDLYLEKTSIRKCLNKVKESYKGFHFEYIPI